MCSTVAKPVLNGTPSRGVHTLIWQWLTEVNKTYMSNTCKHTGADKLAAVVLRFLSTWSEQDGWQSLAYVRQLAPSPSHFPSLCELCLSCSQKEATGFLMLLMEGNFKMLFVLRPSFGGLRVLWEHLVAVVSNSNDDGEWSGWQRREGDRWVGWGLRKWLSEWKNSREAIGTEEEAKAWWKEDGDG